jgi:signal transduction histidine kinase
VCLAGKAVLAPEAMMPLVAPELAEVSFLCRHSEEADPAVLYTSTTGVSRWRGAAVHLVLRARFSMHAVLSLVFSNENVKGRLFFLGKPGMTSDDLTLGEIVSRHIAGRLNHFYLREHLAGTVVLQERLHLARDLHDGAFHVLTGIVLEMERLLRMPEIQLASGDRVRELQGSLAEGQRAMRLLIDRLRMAAPEPAADVSLEARLKSLAERLERQWGVTIQWTVMDCEELPPTVLDEIYLMVHEALLNVGRHASATAARVSVTASAERVTIVVADDGRGFGFTGRYDHETLVARRIGPWSLKQRAAALGGTVAIESGSGPTVVEVQFPVRAASG